jgi:hypothetical protein
MYVLLKGKYSLDKEQVDLQRTKNGCYLEQVLLLNIQQVEEIDVGVEDSVQNVIERDLIVVVDFAAVVVVYLVELLRQRMQWLR